MKRRITIGAVILSLIALIAIGTLAYLTTEGNVTNVITVGSVDLELFEMAYNSEGRLVPYTDPDAKGMPGESFSKIPIIKNVGTGDLYTRVKVNVVVTSSLGEELLAEPIGFDSDLTKWLIRDGWYYYVDAVTPGSEVRFFENVKFSEDMGNEYKDCTIEINVRAQGVQVKNNEIPESGSVLDVNGWPKD